MWSELFAVFLFFLANLCAAIGGMLAWLITRCTANHRAEIFGPVMTKVVGALIVPAFWFDHLGRRFA